MVALRDTYYYLLENPDQRRFALCGESIAYRSLTFSREVYEASRRFRFATWAHAYSDWLEIGRPLGLDFAPGRNTCLKIVLKVKDEPQLLPQWIAYHAGLVGFHNLIILDCGSTDADHLAILESIRSQVLILDFPHYYDTIHITENNTAFYDLLARNCRYICVLDADEFLFGYVDGVIGRDCVIDILRGGNERVYAGTWFQNLTAPEDGSGRLDWSRPLRFDNSPAGIAAGTVGGKALVRADLGTHFKHVGHNLHDRGVAAAMRPESFGRFGLLHVSRLGDAIARARSLKHLRAKGVVPAGLEAAEAIEAFLRARAAAGDLGPIETRYAAPFIAPEVAPETSSSFETALIDRGTPERNAAFRAGIEAFDFLRLLG